MTVYVDDMYRYPMGQFRSYRWNMKMSHLMADTTEELLAMVDKIGVLRRWIQRAGEPGEHFDIVMTKRGLAIAAGAVEVTLKEMAAYNSYRMRVWDEPNRQALIFAMSPAMALQMRAA